LILIVVLSFLTFLLRNIFWTLHKEFEVKKLLWASHLDVTKSFVMVTLDVIIIAFLICFALLFLSGIILNFYLNALFGISILELFNNIFIVIIALIAQLLLVGWISIFLAYTFTHSMEKKLQA
jgi:preprotein translocase subunit SecE